MSLLIRTALGPDTEAVVRIYVDSWNQGFGNLMPAISADPDRVERWAKDLAQPPPHRWWVAVRGDQLVGFAGICPSRDPVDPQLDWTLEHYSRGAAFYAATGWRPSGVTREAGSQVRYEHDLVRLDVAAG